MQATLTPGHSSNSELLAGASTLELVSHPLCPYVQRAVIVLAEKGIAHTRTYVDLAQPPAWFREISPLGKVPLLRVGEEVLFESAVICEYLDEAYVPRIHPENALLRAKHRAWVEFGSAALNTIWQFYTAPDNASLNNIAQALREKFSTIEKQLGDGPYFSGEVFSMVDVVFGPVFRYFDAFERIADFGFFDGLEKTARWRRTLAERVSIQNAVTADYPALLREFLRARGSALAQRMGI